MYKRQLRDRKGALIEIKGEKLADKLGSKWYNEGEKSTRYFLNLLKRKAPDNFQILTNGSGVDIGTQELIEQEIVQFYKSLYEDYDKNQIRDVPISDNFFGLITAVSDEDDVKMASRITPKELEETLLTCKDSAPGPDGIPYSYYKVLWLSLIHISEPTRRS